MNTKDKIKKIAINLHNKYEEEAKKAGWDTQQSTKVEFDELPEANKQVMFHIAEYIESLVQEAVEEIHNKVKEVFSTRLSLTENWQPVFIDYEAKNLLIGQLEDLEYDINSFIEELLVPKEKE